MDTSEATGTSLLEQPEAVALLGDAVVTSGQIEGCKRRLVEFMQRYLPWFYRKEQRTNATIVIQGLLGGLERKTAEPIATEHGVPRRPIQRLVGAGQWDDEAVLGKLRRDVVATMGDPGGVLVLDPSAFPKKGKNSVGVARQWCGRLGKKENCQVGVFLAYATDRGQAPLDRRLYLPKDWAADNARRVKCHVPASVRFQESWRIGLDIIQAHRQQVPHRWVVADDEFGRVGEFRAELRKNNEPYVLDVPCATSVRDEPFGQQDSDAGQMDGRRVGPFVRAEAWAAAQPSIRWRDMTVKAGQKGPIRVRAIMTAVRTKLGGRIGPQEWLLVLRPMHPGPGEPTSSYHVVWADRSVTLDEVVTVHGRRHQIEQMFQQAKGEAGLDHYEVRSYVGWHHHITLSFMALWFLCQERLSQGKKLQR